MNNDRPSLLNDDLVWTWTIKSTNARFSDGKFCEATEVSCTIKNVTTGLISPILHLLTGDDVKSIILQYKGISCDFTCFGLNPSEIVWIGGGVGITPFLAMHQGLLKTGGIKNVGITLLYACRPEEAILIESLVGSEAFENITVFSSTLKSNNNNYRVLNRRIQSSDITTIPSIRNKFPFICGPSKLTECVVSWLQNDAGVNINQIHFKDFKLLWL